MDWEQRIAHQDRYIRELEMNTLRLRERNDDLEKKIHELQDKIKELLSESQ